MSLFLILGLAHMAIEDALGLSLRKRRRKLRRLLLGGLRLLGLARLRDSSLRGGLGQWSPRSALATRSGVDEALYLRIMRSRSRRSSDDSREDFVKVRGKIVATRVDVDGGIEDFDVGSFLNPPLNPIFLIIKDGYVFFAKVVVFFSCVLEHSRFIFTLSIGGGGGVLMVTG